MYNIKKRKKKVLPKPCYVIIRVGVHYRGGFFWAFSQKSPHAVLQSLHVHFLGRFSVVNLNLVDLMDE